MKARGPDHKTNATWFASTSAVPPREPSRRKWRLAARGGSPAAHIPRRVRQASMRRRSAGTHPKWKKKGKGPDPSRSPGLWDSESGRRVDQTRRPPGRERSSDSRCSYDGASGRPHISSGTAHANAREPARALALRRAVRLFTMVSWFVSVPKRRCRASIPGPALRAKVRRLSKRQLAV